MQSLATRPWCQRHAEKAALSIGLASNGADGGLDRETRCLIDRQIGLTAEDFWVARHVALGTDTLRGRNDPVTLQYAQFPDDCFHHDQRTQKTASSRTSSAESARAASGPANDRLKMNKAAPPIDQNPRF
jgi:hypothetical protein